MKTVSRLRPCYELEGRSSLLGQPESEFNGPGYVVLRAFKLRTAELFNREHSKKNR